MYHVVAATTNPAKLTAISQGFSALFSERSCHIEGVGSTVACQPNR